MNYWQIALVMAGVIGCGWALTSVASVPRNDPSKFLYLIAFLGFFGLIWLGVRHREN